VGTVTVGVDLGQRRDPSAVAVVERERRPREPRGTETHHLVRHLERLRLNTPYPAVAERVAVVVAGVQTQAGQRPTLYVDATGVGTPIVDILRATEVPARLVAVYFTHGDRRTREQGEIRLGKAWLVSRLQALLQSGRLHLPRTDEAEALGQELLDYEIRVDEHANDRYGAFKVGTHDDLVTALGLATQEDDADVLVMPGGAWQPSISSRHLAETQPWHPLGGRYS
jgi:hypothetical protein